MKWISQLVIGEAMRNSNKRTIFILGAAGAGAVLLFSSAFATETITFTYDALGRLTKSVHTGTVNNNQQTVYTLDPAGNRTNTTTTNAP